MTITRANILQNIEETDAFLAAMVQTHQVRLRRSIVALERRIIAAAKNLRTDEYGNLRGPFWTLSEMTDLHRDMAVAYAETYNAAAHRNVAEYSRINTHITNQFGKLHIEAAFNRTDLVMARTLEDTDFTIYAGLGVDSRNRITQAVYNSVLIGAPFADLTTEIRGALRGHKDIRGRPLESYATVYAQDATMGYYRTMHLKKAEDAGLDHWLYVGDVIETTRKFCKRHVMKVYDAAKINELDKTEWGGKSGSLWTDAGGYNCRHHWHGVDPEWLEEDDDKETADD
ncbi:MAG: hypothetical protein GY851_35600 [bacterium]|nr:hypothetical protein [bacterium]